MSELSSDTLPFSPQRQQAFLGHCVYNQKVYGQVGHLLTPSWFAGEFNQAILQALQDWHKTYSRHPTVDELFDSKEFSGYDPAKRLKLMAQKGLLLNATSLYGADALLAEVGAWQKARLLQTTLPKVIRCYRDEKVDEAVTVINKMVAEYFKLNVHGRAEATFEDFGPELLAQQDKTINTGCSFGLKLLDDTLDDSGSGNSLLPGDMTILLAATNRGKSSNLVTTAAHNLKQGKSVLFVFHEGRIMEMKEKVMRCFCNKTKQELIQAYSTPEGTEVMKAVEDYLAKFLTLLPAFDAGLNIEDVAATIEQYQEKRIATTGRGYDLLIDDYPARLTTKQAANGNLQMRHIVGIVYNYLMQLGLKHEFHVLVAIQTNRTGSAQARKTGASKMAEALINLEDVAEAWDPITAAANVISLNRNGEDEENNIVSFLLCKSRSSETGVVFVAKSDYSRCRVFSNDMPSYSYRGDFCLGSKKKDLFTTFNGQMVPAKNIKVLRSW